MEDESLTKKLKQIASFRTWSAGQDELRFVFNSIVGGKVILIVEGEELKARVEVVEKDEIPGNLHSFDDAGSSD